MGITVVFREEGDVYFGDTRTRCGICNFSDAEIKAIIEKMS
jgi:hypothetical protein